MSGTRHRRFAVLVALLGILTAASAAELEVTYVDGTLQVRQANVWKTLEIGDVVQDDATVQFDGLGVAELAGTGVRVTLRQKGTFELGSIVAKSREVASSGLGAMVKGRVAGLILGTPKSSSAVMGVRAAEAGTDKEQVNWLGSASDLIAQSKKSLAEGNYEQALKTLAEAYDYADESEEPEVLFYMGYAHAMLDRAAKALDTLSEVQMERTDPLYGDFLILRGQLLMDALSFTEAYTSFDNYRTQLPGGANLQLANLLAGYCASELGDRTEARRSLDVAQRADPASDYGKKATELLGKL